MGGAEAQSAAAFHHRLAEPEGKQTDSILRLFAARRIVVDRAGDAADIGIPIRSVFAADHLLDDNRHLFIAEEVVCRFQIFFRPTEVGGRPYRSDRVGKLFQADLLASPVGDHHGFVHSGKGLVVGILQQGRGADADRLLDDGEDMPEVHDQFLGEGFREKDRKQRFIRQVGGGDVLQFIRFDECFKLIGGDDDGPGDRKVDIRVLRRNPRLAQDHVDERQAAAFSAERAGSDSAEEEGLIVVRRGELRDDSFGPLGAVGSDRFDHLVPDPGHVAAFGNLQRLDLGGDRIKALRFQPAGEVFVPEVVFEGGQIDLGKDVLQGPHRLHPGDLRPGCGVSEDERAEAVVGPHIGSQLREEGAAPLVDEMSADSFRRLLHREVVGLEENRKFAVSAVELLGKGEPRISVMDAIHLVGDVRDDPDDVFLICFVQREGFLIGFGQNDFGAAARSQRSSPGVQRFKDYRLSLLNQACVDHRQVGGVEADRVLNKDDQTDIRLGNIMVQVHPVFHQLDHRQKDRGIALPVEEVINRD